MGVSWVVGLSLWLDLHPMDKLNPFKRSKLCGLRSAGVSSLTCIISNTVKGKLRKALFTEFLPQHERDVRVIPLFSKSDHQKVASLFTLFRRYFN